MLLFYGSWLCCLALVLFKLLASATCQVIGSYYDESASDEYSIEYSKPLPRPNSSPNRYDGKRSVNVNYKYEQLLLDKLITNYNKNLRPPHGTVQIKFSLNLNQIINLIEKDQIIVINAFIDHEWVDKRLSWGTCNNNRM
jgi:hypothetical protein